MVKNFKHYFGILFLFPLACMSQVPDVLIQNKFLWVEWETNHSKEYKQLEIEKIEDNLIDDLKGSAINSNADILGNFHFLDLDFDGDEDIVYYGFAGSESDRTLFFRNQNGSYIKFLDLFGEIVEMWRSSVTSPVSFKLLEYSCCGGVSSSIQVYVPIINGKAIDYRLSDKVAYISDTDFPMNFTFNEKPFLVTNEKYVLRKSPNISLENSNKGVISVYTTGSKGYALAESTDETGRIWWFVVMINNIPPKQNAFKNGNNSDLIIPKSLGWMSSRFLEGIK